MKVVTFANEAKHDLRNMSLTAYRYLGISKLGPNISVSNTVEVHLETSGERLHLHETPANEVIR